MKVETKKTISLTMSEKEAGKVLMMLSAVSRNNDDLPEWVCNTASDMAEILERAGVEE